MLRGRRNKVPQTPPTAGLHTSKEQLARPSAHPAVRSATTPPASASTHPQALRTGQPVGTRTATAPPPPALPRGASSSHKRPGVRLPRGAKRRSQEDRPLYLPSGVPPLSDRTDLRRLDQNAWLFPTVEYDRPPLPRQTDAQLRIIRHQETEIISTVRSKRKGGVWDVAALVVFTPMALIVALIFLVGPIILTVAHFTRDPLLAFAIAGALAVLAEFTVVRILRATTRRRRLRPEQYLP